MISPDLEFVWQDAREQDPVQAAQIDVACVGASLRRITRDELMYLVHNPKSGRLNLFTL